MNVLFDSNVLGTQNHLLATSDGFTKVSKIPIEVWHYSGQLKNDSNKCWDTVLRLSKNIPVPSVPQEYRTMMSTLAPDLHSPPWSCLLPKSIYRRYFEDVMSLTGKVDPNAISYYENVWVHGSSLLSRLKPTKVDGLRVESIVSDSVHNSQVVSTFKPRTGGYAQPVVYDRFGTVTGRLTVESGPNILLLKKEHRSILKSSFQGGSIVSLDFSSLEARILLYESGGTCDEQDLYESIANRLGGIPRSVVKAAVLAELYGSSKNALALTLGMSHDSLMKFINKVEEIINTKKLLSRLKQQFSADGIITNRYGRKLEVSRPQDNIFINYYAQSTGVDVSLMGFNQVLNLLGTDGVRPLFVLHDALILDVREDRMKDVENIMSLQVQGYSSKFPLKMEVL